jgi:hypothetical protein
MPKIIMISKSINYGNIEDVTVAEFGNGTIAICSAKGDGYEGLLMKSSEKRSIGEIGEKYDDSDQFNPELSIVFRNHESFNVFYEAVLEVKNEFEKQTDRVSYCLTFGQAIEAAKQGKKVARKGWNGAGMFAYIVPANSYPAVSEVAKSHFGENAMVPYREYWALKTAQNDVATWSPSGSDSLANDWEIVN